MRVQVNLATRPFVELRPFFLRLRLLMAALAVVGLLLAVGAHVLSARLEKQQIELDQLRDQTIAVQQAKLHTEQRMRQPGNAAVLDRAHFLNTLFLRKSFSWTAVMMDLENVLPAGVQVTSIEPAVTTDGEVVIRLRVAGERDRAVQLVRNLERSRRFLNPRLGSESAQTREQPGVNGARPGVPAAAIPAVPTGPPSVEFEILANYNPLPADEPYAVGRRAGAVAEATPSASLVSAGHSASLAHTAPSGLRSSSNVRQGFPRDGVLLAPYAGPPVNSGTRSVPPTAQRGGAR